MHSSEPETLHPAGLDPFLDPDAVSGIPVPVRRYAPEPARDDIPNWSKNDAESED